MCFISFVILQIYYENTYRLEPPAKFRADKVQPIIQDVLDKNLEGRPKKALFPSVKFI